MDREPRRKEPQEPGSSVDEQVEDSFPASDPPSYNAGNRVGRPKRKHPDETRKKKRAVEPR